MLRILRRWFPTLFPKKYRAEPQNHIDWPELEKKLDYKIKDKDIFCEALRHRSHQSCLPPLQMLSNERLEFLGDALINFYVGEFLYKIYSEAPEGDLTIMRSVLVSREFLAKKGKQIRLGDHLALGEGEKRSGGRYKDSILSNTLESIIGALYLDGGHDDARNFIEKVILLDHESVLESEGNNYKGDLLEYVQKRHLPMPKFITKRETGPEHKKTYSVAVQMGGETMGTGKGKNKKIAEQKAARSALTKIRKKS